MTTVLDVLKQVASTSSKNEKENILSENADSLLKQICEYTYSPTIRFFMKIVS